MLTSIGATHYKHSLTKGANMQNVKSDKSLIRISSVPRAPTIWCRRVCGREVVLYLFSSVWESADRYLIPAI
jgi:hypothetical protein